MDTQPLPQPIGKIKKKKKTKYNKTIHINILEKVLSAGGSIGTICRQSGISKKTFHNWKNTYPDYKEAYDIYINHAEEIWETLPLQKPDIPMAYWQTLWRNRFNQGRLPLQKPDNKDNLKEALEGLDQHLYDGQMSIDEHSKAVATLEKKGKVTLLHFAVAKFLGKSVTEIEQMTVEELQEKMNDIVQRVQR